MTNRFHVGPEDLANMVEIARVSSYEPDKKAWTELALYFRDDAARPWVSVVEGRTDALDMSNRFIAAAMGTAARAMSWFAPTKLRDKLSYAVSDRIGDDPDNMARELLTDLEARAYASEESPHHAAEIARRGGRLLADPVRREGSAVDDIVRDLRENAAGIAENAAIGAALDQAILDGAVTGVSAAVDRIFKVRVVGFTADSLYEVLRWLYPDSVSDAERSRLLERDFGIPARTTRRALAVECGDQTGELGPWVNMFMVAMRFFDRELWMAGQATIAKVES